MKGKVIVTGIAVAALGVAGLDLLARRALRRFESLDADALDLPGRRFWVRGVAVHYVERGEGAPVVLVHGFGGSTFSFRETIPALAQRYRVIAVDLPGFGFSDRGAQLEYSHSNWVDLLREFLRRQGIERAAFLGHSMGGAVVQRLAVAAPELVERLVLVASVSAADRPPRPAPRGLGPAVRAVQAGIATNPRALRWLARRTNYDPAFITDEVLHGYALPSRLPGSAAAVRKLAADTARDPAVDLGAIAAPTLIIWGERDRVVPLRVGEQLRDAIPGARLEIVPRAGHLPLEEQPERCNRLLLDFLGERSAADRQVNGGRNGATAVSVNGV